jgi:hypothetical protein
MPLQYSAHRDIVTRRIGAETLLVPICGHVADLEAIYTLDEIGSRVWSRLEPGASLPELVTPEVAVSDLTQLLAELQQARLIRIEEREGA